MPKRKKGNLAKCKGRKIEINRREKGIWVRKKRKEREEILCEGENK